MALYARFLRPSLGALGYTTTAVSDCVVRSSEMGYTSYLESMDGSMRAKVAVAAAHILSKGKVADMGMGSGSGSFALASLYPSLEVTGVDLDPEIVQRAQEKYRRPNLSFRIGNIATQCLPTKQSAFINSSVLHHVTSFNGYNPSLVLSTLKEQRDMLEEQGLLIVRDFVSPGNEPIFLDIPASSPDVPLFLRFTKEFRSLDDAPGCPYEEVTPPEGFRRFRLSHKHATEFVLRKDYEEDWADEIREEYTFATTKEFEEIFRSLGMRILSTTPVRNPWIVSKRFEGKFIFRDMHGNELDHPATNCIVVGQKVSPNEGISICKEEKAPHFQYLEMTHFEHIETGNVFDLARRAGSMLDIAPFFIDNDRFHMLARREYPRPILGEGNAPLLDGSSPPKYITEPMNVQRHLKPTAQTIEESLQNYGNIQIRQFHDGIRIFPSPGGIQEEIISKIIEIEQINICNPHVNTSGFSTSGIVRAIEANQILRATQVGALRDARLELNVYKLFQNYGIAPEPWIGEEITVSEGSKPNTIGDIFSTKPRRLFRPTHTSAHFLDIQSGLFVERGKNSKKLAAQLLQYVIPKEYSINTIAVALLRRHNGEIFIGLDDDDRPAMQCFDGHSNMYVAPAWRIPKGLQGVKKPRQWIVERLSEEHALTTKQIWDLGSPYFPAPGITPEFVTPLAVEAIETDPFHSKVTWVSLKELASNQDHILDGHLRIVALRAAHALSLLTGKET